MPSVCLGRRPINLNQEVQTRDIKLKLCASEINAELKSTNITFQLRRYINHRVFTMMNSGSEFNLKLV